MSKERFNNQVCAEFQTGSGISSETLNNAFPDISFKPDIRGLLTRDNIITALAIGSMATVASSLDEASKQEFANSVKQVGVFFVGGAATATAYELLFQHSKLKETLGSAVLGGIVAGSLGSAVVDIYNNSSDIGQYLQALAQTPGQLLLIKKIAEK